MKIQDIIFHLENQGEWVNRRKTRDHLLIGNDQTEINKMIVCWVPTKDIIQKAIDEHYHFIICHENPFYLDSTFMHSAIIDATKDKKSLLENHQITIYRCHDLWDLYPAYGVLDMWLKLLHFNNHKTINQGFYKIIYNVNMATQDLAIHIKKYIALYGENGIEVIGDLNKHIDNLAIGTGDITDVFEMTDLNADACLVSDDGINNWVSVQWCMDHHIPLIVVNHRTAENAGMLGMKNYLNHIFPDLYIEFLTNNYQIYHFE